MKKKIRHFLKKISNNLGLKIFSFCSAFVIWIVVVNNIDPIKTVTISDIPVTIANMESLTAKDLVPAVVYGNQIDITIKARKSICDSITSDNIIATADCEKIYVTDTVPIDIAFSGYDEGEIEIISGQNQYMKLSLEEYLTREFKIKTETEGEPASGFVVGTSVSSPNVISVTGSKTLVNRIQYVAAKVNVERLSTRTIITVTPVIYDINDEIMNSDNFTVSSDTLRVTVEFYKTKSVTLSADTIGIPETGYKVSDIIFQPSEVIFSGTDEDLLLLPELLSVSVDVTGRKSSVESNVDIMSLVEANLSSLSLVDRDSVLAITVYIEEAPEGTAFDNGEETGTGNASGNGNGTDTENSSGTGNTSDGENETGTGNTSGVENETGTGNQSVTGNASGS